MNDIKDIPNRSREKVYKISSSYEYIGLKLMYIFKIYVRGERFPEGKLSQHLHHKFLKECIEFLCKNDDMFELLQVNARSFFLGVSELFLNQVVANTLVQLNNDKDENGVPMIAITLPMIVDRLSEIVSKLSRVRYLEFEFCYFIIKIAISEYYKYTPQSLISKFFKSVDTVLKAMIDFEKDKINDPDIAILEENKFIGPNYIELRDLEVDILNAIPFYAPFMEQSELETLVVSSTRLQIHKVSIYIYEQREDFTKCMDIYLNSPGSKREDVFEWLKALSKKRNILSQESIEGIEKEILRVIKDLVTINSIETGKVIDHWLPDQQKLVIKNLESNPDLQLKYLKDYLKEREEDIRKTMLSFNRTSEMSKEITEYRSFLILHVKLLAELDMSELKEVVMRDYYPIE